MRYRLSEIAATRDLRFGTCEAGIRILVIPHFQVRCPRIRRISGDNKSLVKWNFGLLLQKQRGCMITGKGHELRRHAR